MKETILVNAIKEITMPEQMKAELSDSCQRRIHEKKPFFCFSRPLTAAAAAIAFLIGIYIPSYAAYDLHQTKNIEVFFDTGVSQSQIDEVGKSLSNMEGIYAFRFISAKEAWQKFSKEFLTEELASSFHENPLKDSFSYHVVIRWNASTKEIREQIEQLNGVRLVADQYELKELQ